MVRPIYAHEMCDPDFSWLISTFRENNPEYFAVESSCLPVVLINFGNPVKHAEEEISHDPEETEEFAGVERATKEESR